MSNGPADIRPEEFRTVRPIQENDKRKLQLSPASSLSKALRILQETKLPNVTK